MRLAPRDQPLLDETMELPSLRVAPGPPHPRGGRGSFSSSYSSNFAGTDSLCSFNSSQIFEDSDDREVDVDDVDSNSSRGDYALLSMPVESVKRVVPTTGVVTRPRSTDTSLWHSHNSSYRRTTAIADALRELREGRTAVAVAADEEHEQQDDEEEHKKKVKPSVGLRQLVARLSTHRDLFVLSMGLLAATIHGALWALLGREVKNALSAFAPFDRRDVDFAALTLMLLSLALGVTAYAAHLCLSHTAERMLRALREQVLRHVLLGPHQPWFDVNASLASSLGGELTREAPTIRHGLGPELGAVCRFLTQFVGGFAVAFAMLWDLTLAVSCVAPVVVCVLVLLTDRASTETDNEADAVAAEALSNMQTVLALNAQRRVREKHALRVRIAERYRVVQHGKYAALQGTLTGTLWVMSAVGLWYGGKKVYDGQAEPAQVFETLLGVAIGSHALGHLLPSFAAVARAQTAASALFSLLETPSKSISQSQLGVENPLPRPASFSGAVMAVDLHFSYPTRPQRPALRGCNVSLLAGECVVIVGGSGSGKSTLMTLLTRLYEPAQGLILLDGREMNSLDPTWVRAQLGVVTQDVTLFRASIFDNIMMGLVALRELSGRSSGQMEERVVNAAQRADVHDFIRSLPDGYSTRVGENGAVKLTTQQRQRIALARALIREPKLLLLDELALSPQELLSRFGGAVGAGSTTMLLCTRQANAAAVEYADKIMVLEAGKIVEQGTHVELLHRGNSFYRRLRLTQPTFVREHERTLSAESTAAMRSQRRVTKATPTSPTKLTKRDITALARPERKFLAFGLVASVVVGLAAPMLGVLVSRMLADMTETYSSLLETENAANVVKTLRPLVMRHGFFLSAGAAVIVVFQSIQLFCLDAATERVASRLRDLHFNSLLAQPLPFFDAPQHTAEVLTKSLAEEASTASLVIGRAQGYKLQILCTLAASLIVAFWRGSWMLTLVLLAALPLLLIGEAICNPHTPKPTSSLGETESEDAVEVHVNEALRNRQAVVTLGLENSWCSSFEALLQRPLRHTRHHAQHEAVARGFSAVVMVAASALACWLSGVLVHYGDASFRELTRSFLVVLFSAHSLGLAVAWMNCISGAEQAGASIFALRDAAIVAGSANGLAPPLASPSSSDGEHSPLPQSPMLRGSVTLQDVKFAYPTRPSSLILNGLSLRIQAGETVALCGPRGAGISTVFALLEGFYDLSSASGNSGRVLLDGVDIRSLDVSWLRAQISFVGPEPTLFLGTIAENIAYGMAAPPTLDMIVAAAEVAHAHAFITRLPDGYATRVGGQLQLSPGQRQRIVLARAVLQDTRLLLLDEPTRSLGAESEKIAVQQALDTIVAQRVRRTTVIAAHPGDSATVRNADSIYVIDGGQVVDRGTHAELLRFRDGVYARLFRESAWSPTSSSSYTVGTSAT
ncbi:ABC transporter B family member 2 [Phytophthora fragariae]|uniref:ABC transporter B family member 2 n=2 Tax=Phytophthora fragariae TaxID=53985 RepID=A0A6A3TDL5_9STRA|nr:ABC transporter B family member 2 [Phytophthora fragariae]KAE8993572.1 ABC transporter B family member 2 [Phytophthora fragariae]KAE9128572.1 ABC transporter B family member 2 [Phytophthora fragariae]KAE9195095.1 ABC transporter B family member 2 [Phytophthora fragariae]KAE9294652.1 ABC transporter B family member 2 [Phytophthora fragariae]